MDVVIPTCTSASSSQLTGVFNWCRQLADMYDDNAAKAYVYTVARAAMKVYHPEDAAGAILYALNARRMALGDPVPWRMAISTTFPLDGCATPLLEIGAGTKSAAC